jgi:hypothetical protein
MNGSENNNPVPLTTIKIDTDTRDRLADLGRKSESYDTIIKRLMDGWNLLNPVQRENLMNRGR